MSDTTVIKYDPTDASILESMRAIAEMAIRRYAYSVLLQHLDDTSAQDMATTLYSVEIDDRDVVLHANDDPPLVLFRVSLRKLDA